MRSAGVLALALVMILAGCPADGDVEATVTPADVPDLPSPTPTGTPAGSLSVDCDVPTPPPASAAQPEPPTGPASVPTDDGVVNASAVVERHESALSNHRYRLAAPDRTIFATENWAALRATIGENGSPISHYAINGTRYTYFFEDGGRARFGFSTYEPGPTMTALGDTVSLTGGPTIERVLSAYPHHVSEVRADGWTVLRATHDTQDGDEAVGVEYFNSTVIVDRRGIVRRVDTRVVADDRTDFPLSGTTSLWITHVGEASFDRPDWVCMAAEQWGQVGDTVRETAR